MHCRLMDMNIFQGITKRYFGIEQNLARHVVNNSAGLSSSLSMKPNNYPFLQFNDLLQSGNRVGILGSLYP